ncbi:M14 family metallocarboxypeptidase [Bacillus gobiensis]|uniref:M14 family metallopeptidase n=1 Tax=Bacillus gobiensis TaxID=1441095 RepID=UPI003D23D81A
MKTKKIEFIAAASLLFSGIGISQTVQAETPYYGKNYSQPEQVLKLYPDPKEIFQTPAFVKEGDEFTTQEEMIEYLHTIADKSSYVSIKNIGTSLENRDIPALYFTKDKRIHSISNKPLVWLQAQIHGNEPASGESALAIAEKLAGDYGENILDKINVIIVPRINPDGSYAFNRRLASGLDGNRDHVKLDSAEVQAVHREFNRYSPEVVIDAHEYSIGENSFAEIGSEGALKYHDLLILSGKNLNIPEKIRSTSDDLYIHSVMEKLKDEGFSSDPYYTTSGSDENGAINIYEGGTEARIGRNAIGLQPALSFLVESRGIGIGRENFARRVGAQVTTHEEILNLTAEHADQIKKLVTYERFNLIAKGLNPNDQDDVVIKSEFADPKEDTLKLVDIAEGHVIDAPVQYYSATDSKATLTRKRPTAYLVLPGHEEVEEKLAVQGVKGYTLHKKMKLPVEAFQVTSKEQDGITEGRPVINVATELVNEQREFPKGTKIYFTSQQQNGLLSISLEPESIDSYVSTGFIPSEAGQTLPVYRFVLDRKALNINE